MNGSESVQSKTLIAISATSKLFDVPVRSAAATSYLYDYALITAVSD